MSANPDVTIRRRDPSVTREVPLVREVPKGAPARFRGRLVRRCAPEGCNLTKIVMVSLVILLVALASVRIVHRFQGDPKPSRPAANHFATSLSPYVVAGYRTLPHGRAACRIQNPPISERLCQRLVYREETRLNQTLKQQGLDLAELQERHDKSVVDSQGIKLGMRPLRLENYKRALEYVEKELIHRRYSFQNPDRTITFFKTLNRIISEGLPHDGKPGEYRTFWNIVSEDAGPEFKARMGAKIRQIGTDRDVELFQSSLAKFKDGLHVGLSRLNDEELDESQPERS